MLLSDVYSGVTVDVPDSPVSPPRNDRRILPVETSRNSDQQDLSGSTSPCGSLVVQDSSDSEDDLEYSENVNSGNGHVIENGMRMRKLSESEAQGTWTLPKLHEPEEVERKYGSLKSTYILGRDSEEFERKSAQNYTEQLLKLLPSLLNSSSVYEIDQSILEFSSKVCDSKLLLSIFL